MNWITAKVKKIVSKYQGRYGKYLGVTVAVLFLAALPVPVPGIAFGIQGVAEVARLCGLKF